MWGRGREGGGGLMYLARFSNVIDFFNDSKTFMLRYICTEFGFKGPVKIHPTFHSTAIGSPI